MRRRSRAWPNRRRDRIGSELEVDEMDGSIAGPHDQNEDDGCVKQSLQENAPAFEALETTRSVVADLQDAQDHDPEDSRSRWLRKYRGFRPAESEKPRGKCLYLIKGTRPEQQPAIATENEEYGDSKRCG